LPGWARFTPGVSSRKKNNRPDRNLNTLGYSELYLMTLLATKGIGRKTNSERQKRIQELLGFHCWAFRIGTWATEDTLLFLVYERLDSESPNRSPSMAKRLPWREPKPAKPRDRESRHKKTSSQASVPNGLAWNTSNALEALRFTIRYKIFDRWVSPPINRWGRRRCEPASTFIPASLFWFFACSSCLCALRVAPAEASVDSRG
jgi:hypothetical protein